MISPAPATGGPRFGGLNRIELGICVLGLALTIFVMLLEWVIHAPMPVIFGTASLALIVLAWLLGEATDQLGHTVGGRAAGIMNATFGNLPELVIVILLLNKGLEEVAKASILGSVMGNMLLVMGAAIFFGGLKNGAQSFTPVVAGLPSAMLMLSVVGLSIPTAEKFLPEVGAASEHLQGISLATAIVLFLVYIASLIYFFREGEVTEEKGEARWIKMASITLLGVSAAGVAITSEALVQSIEGTVTSLGISETFLGFILVPIVGNIAEHLVAVQVAWRNDMDFAMTIALGSSVQVAIALAPIAVFISYFLGNPMDLVFTPLQVLSLILAVVAVSLVLREGKTAWIEGLQLMAIYAIIAIAFWY